MAGFINTQSIFTEYNEGEGFSSAIGSLSPRTAKRQKNESTHHNISVFTDSYLIKTIE